MSGASLRKTARNLSTPYNREAKPMQVQVQVPAPVGAKDLTARRACGSVSQRMLESAQQASAETTIANSSGGGSRSRDGKELAQLNVPNPGAPAWRSATVSATVSGIAWYTHTCVHK